MTSLPRGPLSALCVPLIVAAACDHSRVTAANDSAAAIAQLSLLDGTDWNPPVNIGPPINTSASEANAALSPDGLSLYFASDRPGSLGSTDIWVSHRDCETCPWGTPFNLGAPVNTTGLEAGPRLSDDGLLLFIQSDRPGGLGLNDIYVSRRTNAKNDLGWSTPVNLGPGVNSTDDDQAPQYVQTFQDGRGNLYFNRGTLDGQDLYVATITSAGEVKTPAVPVTELNTTGTREFHPSLRADGLEIFFSSTRPGGVGGNDVWTATRRSVKDVWLAAINLKAVNTTDSEAQPSLSADGRTLVFTSTRPGGQGGNDIWTSTRKPKTQ